MKIFCVTKCVETTAEMNHVGRLVCRACGEPVEPVIIRPRD